jgi:hypothetical protein
VPGLIFQSSPTDLLFAEKALKSIATKDKTEHGTGDDELDVYGQKHWIPP